MSKVCSITGSKSSRGSIIHRRGMAKKKGGVGRHVTKNVPRTFSPNLHEHRVWVAELKKFVRVKVTARAIEDDQQEWRLRDPEKGRANRRLIRSGDFFARFRGFAPAAFFRRH